jgi:hypothetical protein
LIERDVARVVERRASLKRCQFNCRRAKIESGECDIREGEVLNEERVVGDCVRKREVVGQIMTVKRSDCTCRLDCDVAKSEIFVLDAVETAYSVSKTQTIELC